MKPVVAAKEPRCTGQFDTTATNLPVTCHIEKSDAVSAECRELDDALDALVIKWERFKLLHK